MKIDKHNPRHWLYLLQSAITILITIPARLLRHSNANTVVLYGHKLNGNLLSLYDYIKDDDRFDTYYLTLDKKYFYELKKNDVKVLYMGSIKDMAKVSRSTTIVSDHGLHTLRIYQKLTNIRFADVWHGIAFKGFSPQTFSHLHNHNQVWVSSEYMKKVYVNDFGFKDDRIKVTGYGRVDSLVNRSWSKDKILDKYDISKKYSSVVLIAPTWKQDNKGRSIIPFGVKERTFFKELDVLAQNLNSLFIFRAHLNVNELHINIKLKNVRFMPYIDYPVAEEFLYISDMLITDWSSIAFDYLPLKLPTVFLDVPAPFSEGFTLGPEHRYGEVVKTFIRLKDSIEKYLKHPEKYLNKYEKNIENTIKVAYGSTLDGRATERYVDNLTEILTPTLN